MGEKQLPRTTSRYNGLTQRGCSDYIRGLGKEHVFLARMTALTPNGQTCAVKRGIRGARSSA